MAALVRELAQEIFGAGEFDIHVCRRGPLPSLVSYGIELAGEDFAELLDTVQALENCLFDELSGILAAMCSMKAQAMNDFQFVPDFCSVQCRNGMLRLRMDANVPQDEQEKWWERHGEDSLFAGAVY